MTVDFSPVVAVVQVGAVKTVIALTVFTAVYVAIFLGLKGRVRKPVAGGAGSRSIGRWVVRH